MGKLDWTSLPKDGADTNRNLRSLNVKRQPDFKSLYGQCLRRHKMGVTCCLLYSMLTECTLCVWVNISICLSVWMFLCLCLSLCASGCLSALLSLFLSFYSFYLIILYNYNISLLILLDLCSLFLI